MWIVRVLLFSNFLNSCCVGIPVWNFTPSDCGPSYLVLGLCRGLAFLISYITSIQPRITLLLLYIFFLISHIDESANAVLLFWHYSQWKEIPWPLHWFTVMFSKHIHRSTFPHTASQCLHIKHLESRKHAQLSLMWNILV